MDPRIGRILPKSQGFHCKLLQNLPKDFTDTQPEELRALRELAAQGEVIERNLWTGITQVRPGAGIAIVGTPEQVADTLQDYIDLGCHSFCLSGYLHDEEAERFGKWVMPILRERNRDRMLAA